MHTGVEEMDDHQLASWLADRAGRGLDHFREQAFESHIHSWTMQDDGDRMAHELLVADLTRFRPHDAVLSEEGVDDRSRLAAQRVWIIDPLDGTHDFANRGSPEWAVHVALTEAGAATAGAVAVPGMRRVFGTGVEPSMRPPDRTERVVITGRSYAGHAYAVADALDARLVACGSAGVKAMMVVRGDADVYVHISGLYEWDVCAPAAVAEAAGFWVSNLDGDPIEYNKHHPTVRGLLIARPEYAQVALGAL